MPETGSPQPRRGEIWLVNFDPQVGQEIRKCRPAVVISLDAVGKLPLRVVTPITEWNDRYTTSPWLVRLRPTPGNGLQKDSAADGFQVKSISNQRFVRKLGVLPKSTCEDIVAAVALCIGFCWPSSQGEAE